jgi:monoamine oxidase
MNTSPTVMVIGAGFAGLSAALDLHDAGVKVTVAEARDRVGGRVWSTRLANGAVAELGAEWIFSRSDVVEELCGRFGLLLLPMGTDFSLRDGGSGASVPEQEEFLRSATTVLERLGADEVRAQTAGDFLDSVAGSDVVRATVRARIQGTFAADPAGIALRAAVADGVFTPGGAGPSFRIDGGNDGLARAIAAGLPDLRLRTLVDSVRHDDAGAEVAAGSERIEADAVVVALPAPIAGRLRFEPELPDRLSERLRELPVGIAAKLVVATRGGPPLRAVQSVEPPF